MKKILVTLLLTAAVAVVVTPANAVTWNYYNFGSSVFDGNDNWSPVFYPNGIGNIPSPGHGGQGGEAYDIEGLNFAFDNTYLYLSITSSFGTGIFNPSVPITYAEGDIFFGFDGSKYDYAIDVSASKLYSVSTWSYIPNSAGGYGGNAIIKNAVGAYAVGRGTILGDVDELYTFYLGLESNPLTPGNGNTYIKEYRFLLSDLGVDPFSKSYISFHQTMECGNDLIEKDYGVVPEPGTMILLGMGLLGMGAHLRRKK